MSYILDALKRAENERTSGSATGPDGSGGGDRDAGWHPATMILAGATLFLAGIGVAALLLRTGASAPPAVTPPDRPQTAVAQQPALQPTIAAVQSEPAADALPEADTPEPAAEPLALDDYGSFDDITTVFQGAGSGAGTTSAAPVATPEAPNAEAQAGTVAAATPETGTLHLGAARLDDMPADYRARFPRLQLQVHVHDADPAKRWIMVEGRRYPEGSVLDQGPRIVEILPDGVILEFSGQQTLLPLTR